MADRAPPGDRSPAIVGREVELQLIDEFTHSLGDGPRALLIRGEAGIGKTTLWRHAVAGCREAGHTVLLTRPAEERCRSRSSGSSTCSKARTSTPKRSMPRRIPSGSAERYSTRFGAGPRRVPWSSRSTTSSGSIPFRPAPFASRSGASRPHRSACWRPYASAPRPRTRLQRCEPCPPAGARPSCSDRLRPPTSGGSSVRPSRRSRDPTLRRIHEVSGGNPLYAIELARGLETEERAYPSSGGGLPLPDSLQAAITRRLEAVPPELQHVLEAVAALGAMSARELSDTLPEHDVEGLLSVGEGLGLLVMEEDLDVRFAHPLVGSAVYARMSPLARRSLHAHLGDLAIDADVRARDTSPCRPTNPTGRSPRCSNRHPNGLVREEHPISRPISPGTACGSRRRETRAPPGGGPSPRS